MNVENDSNVKEENKTSTTKEYDTEDAIAEGLRSLLLPSVELIDDRVRSVRQSQADLRHTIDVLYEDLKKISESHEIPLDLNPYVKKLNNTRRRINIVNNILLNAQERLTKLHFNVKKETDRRKASQDNIIVPKKDSTDQTVTEQSENKTNAQTEINSNNPMPNSD